MMEILWKVFRKGLQGKFTSQVLYIRHKQTLRYDITQEEGLWKKDGGENRYSATMDTNKQPYIFLREKQEAFKL